jgi:S-adenosylmethionine decarboxylase
MHSTINFGEHLTIDGYMGDSSKLNDKELVLKCLTELPAQLGMTLLSEPMLKEASDNHIKDPGGWSGVVVIAESHISVHTFPKRRFVSADVYTCRNGMDQNHVIEYFKNIFGLEEVETNFIKRGTKYPEFNLE